MPLGQRDGGDAMSEFRTHVGEWRAAGEGGIAAAAGVVELPKTLLAIARNFIDQGQPSFAVVLAHTACELATERRISEAITAKGIGFLADVLAKDFFRGGYNMGNSRIRNVYQALTGDDIQDTTWWSEFKASVKRRNKIIHKGAVVAAVEAEESYKAAAGLLSHLKF